MLSNGGWLPGVDQWPLGAHGWPRAVAAPPLVSQLPHLDST